MKFSTGSGAKMSVCWLADQQAAGPKKWGLGCRLCAYALSTAKSQSEQRRTSKSSTAWARFEVNSCNSISAWSLRQHVQRNCHKRAVQKWFGFDRPEAEEVTGLTMIETMLT